MNTIIKKSQPKNNTYSDIISMRIIEKLSPPILPHLKHLFDAIIITEGYPTILKVSKIP